MSARNAVYGNGLGATFNRIRIRRGLAFGLIILAALIAFELFNYSTTEYALADLLGNLSFLGISWATILAIAFCGIDFAGIARLHTPEEGSGQPSETWYLFGAWLLAATMNAMLTWWGVSLAIANHATLNDSVIDRQTLLRVVPIFVAVLVWLIRVLIIGTYSTAGTRLLTQRELRGYSTNRGALNSDNLRSGANRSLGVPSQAGSFKSNYRPNSAGMDNNSSYARQEPVYTAVQSASSARTGNSDNQPASGGSNYQRTRYNNGRN